VGDAVAEVGVITRAEVGVDICGEAGLDGCVDVGVYVAGLLDWDSFHSFSISASSSIELLELRRRDGSLLLLL
jgi:hypothetical protein